MLSCRFVLHGPLFRNIFKYWLVISGQTSQIKFILYFCVYICFNLFTLISGNSFTFFLIALSHCLIFYPHVVSNRSYIPLRVVSCSMTNIPPPHTHTHRNINAFHRCTRLNSRIWNATLSNSFVNPLLLSAGPNTP